MAQETFNDVDVTWASSTIDHTQVTADEGAAEVVTTSAADAAHTFRDGISSPSVSVTFSGSGSAFTLGGGGALAISGMNGSLAAGAVFEKSVEGSEDGQITGSVTILPTPA